MLRFGTGNVCAPAFLPDNFPNIKRQEILFGKQSHFSNATRNLRHVRTGEYSVSMNGKNSPGNKKKEKKMQTNVRREKENGKTTIPLYICFNFRNSWLLLLERAIRKGKGETVTKKGVHIKMHQIHIDQMYQDIYFHLQGYI